MTSMPEDRFTETTKQLSALRQIHAAIYLFRKNQFECAVTLAGAAEGILPATSEPHLFQVLRDSPAAKEIDYNLLINWLKHPIEPETLILAEFEVAIIIVRAISKFMSVYKTGSPAMKDIVRWAFEKGHLPPPQFEE